MAGPEFCEDCGSLPANCRCDDAAPTRPAGLKAGPLVSTDWRVGDFAERIEDHALVKAGEVHQVTQIYRGGYLGFGGRVGGEWNPNGWRKVDQPNPEARPSDPFAAEAAGVVVRAVVEMREKAQDWRRPTLAQVEGPDDLKIYGGTIADDIDRWADLLAAAPLATPPDSEPAAGSVGEDLAAELTRIRDRFLIPTPDKDFTDYAIITRCIAALSTLAPSEEAGEDAGQALYAQGYRDGYQDSFDPQGECDPEDVRRAIDSASIQDGWLANRDTFLAALTGASSK